MHPEVFIFNVNGSIQLFKLWLQYLISFNVDISVFIFLTSLHCHHGFGIYNQDFITWQYWIFNEADFKLLWQNCSFCGQTTIWRICHLSISLDFMIWFVEAVTFHGPKVKSCLLLLKPCGIIVSRLKDAFRFSKERKGYACDNRCIYANNPHMKDKKKSTKCFLKHQSQPGFLIWRRITGYTPFLRSSMQSAVLTPVIFALLRVLTEIKVKIEQEQYNK